MMLIGSKAVYFHYDDARIGSGVYDIWSTKRDLRNFINQYRSLCPISVKQRNNKVIIKFKSVILSISIFSEHSPYATLINLNKKFITHIGDLIVLHVASPTTLYLIKKAHINIESKWHIHINDLHFLKNKISDIQVNSKELHSFNKIYNKILEKDKYMKSMLVPNEIFFNRFKHSYIRIYSHDSLHQATCYYDKPLYTKLKQDLSLAYVHKSYFDNFTHLDKIRLVKEECYALALERILIPFGMLHIECSPKKAYQYALRKICTDATKGWFRDFAVSNYPEIINYDINYVQKFENNLNKNLLSIIRPVNYFEKNKDLFITYKTHILADCKIAFLELC